MRMKSNAFREIHERHWLDRDAFLSLLPSLLPFLLFVVVDRKEATL